MALGYATVGAASRSAMEVEYVKGLVERATGCHRVECSKTRVGNIAATFSLPGDKIEGLARAMATRDGRFMVWHLGLPGGLKLGEPFVEREIASRSGKGPIRGHEIRLAKFEALLENGFRLERPALPAPARDRRSDAEIEAAVLQQLQSEYGWEFHGRTTGGIVLANDGTGTSAACRVLVKDGIARVWSFRGGLKLGAPWREGYDTATGDKAYWAPGHAFFERVQLLSTRPPLAVPQAIAKPGPAPQEVREKVLAMLKYGTPAPDTHHHFIKGGGHPLPNPGFVQLSRGDYTGAMVVPMLRPADGSAHKLEVCGAQLLLPSQNGLGTDKLMLRGSRLDTAMLLFPPPDIQSGAVNMRDWMMNISRGDGNSKPIVLCEGVMTALAVHASGAGHAVCCFSAGNVANVARWLHSHEYDALHGLVIAADNDIGVDRSGNIKSPTLPKLIAVARETEADIAFLGNSYLVGTDARDLWREGGAEAVQRYIARAGKPDEVERRFHAAVRARGAELER